MLMSDIKDMYAPIVVFVYDRPMHLKNTIEALKRNTLASESHLFIYSDGEKENSSREISKRIIEVRNYIKLITGFKSVTIRLSNENKGLAQSIIDGVTEVIRKYHKVIVLEDDIETGAFFLDYMNHALDMYKDSKCVWHVTGWHEPRDGGDIHSSFFYPLMDCWSWGTWSDRWCKYEKDPSRLIKRYDKKRIKEFNVNGLVPDKWNQVIGNYEGLNNTWAIFWYATILENDGLCLAPSVSLVKNTGFDNSGVHGNKKNKVTINHDINHMITKYPEDLEVNEAEYNEVKREYKKRYKNERIREIIKRMIPNKLISYYRNVKRENDG